MKTLRTKFSWQPFLFLTAAIGMLFWASSCSDEPTVHSKGNMLRPISRIVNGNGFEITVEGSEWRGVMLRTVETMAPNEPDATDPLISDTRVGPFTSAKVIAYYVTTDGETGSAMQEVLINNVTWAITHNGTPVVSLGEIFSEDEIPSNLESISPFICTDLPVSISIGPAAGVSSFTIPLRYPEITTATFEPAIRMPATEYKTDKGQVIRTTDDGNPTAADLTEAEADAILRGLGLLDKVEKKGPPTDSYNCHGWTFTCGKKWLGSPDDVKKILTDNGYTEVTDPKPGDIAVYEKDGKITHTGVVRSNDGKGTVKVESKWGRAGRYLHKSGDVPAIYGTPKYYRTTRPAPPGSTDPDKDKHTLKTS